MSNKPLRCMLIGHYGYGNFGDDLFVKSFSELAADRQNLEILVLSTAIPGVNAEFVVPSSVDPSLYSSPTVKGRLIRLWFATIAATRCDVIIWCGGSQFDRSNQGLAKLVVRFVAGVRDLRRLACGISVSSDDLESSVSKWFFKGMTRVSVRDEKSLAALESLAGTWQPIHVRYGGDLAAVLRFHFVANVHRNYISLVIGDYAAVSLDMIQTLSLATAKIANENGLDIKVVCLNHGAHGGDLRLSKKSLGILEEACHGAVTLASSCELDSKLEVLAGSKYVVSMRLHGAICSYFVGIKFVLIEYNKKCTDFLDDVELPQNERLPWPMLDVENTVVSMRDALSGEGAKRTIDNYRKNSKEVFGWVLDGVEK